MAITKPTNARQPNALRSAISSLGPGSTMTCAPMGLSKHNTLLFRHKAKDVGGAGHDEGKVREEEESEDD